MIKNCNCGKEPKLMSCMGLVFYECCGVMGSFPGSKTKEEAEKAWNLYRKPTPTNITPIDVEDFLA